MNIQLRAVLVSFLLILAAGSFAWAAANAQSQNIALGADTSGSDPGWGGGSFPADLVDGLSAYHDTWAHGLAFTGGLQQWMGQPCGWRQATVDFGRPETFERVLVWHHGEEHIPTTYLVEYWDGTGWLPVGGTSSVRYDLRSDTTTWGAIPTETLFPAVTGSRVRFRLNNCDITHGWIYEFEVFAGSAGTISGRVIDSRGNPVVGVVVSDGAGHSATTDSSGRYTFTGLADGTYTLRPALGQRTFTPDTRTVTVPPGGTDQNFEADPVLEYVRPQANCGPATAGALTAQWGQFGVLRTFEADSGDRIEIDCLPGNVPMYAMFYVTPGSPPRPGLFGLDNAVGHCPFQAGLNDIAVIHGGDNDGNGRPDYFIKTLWLSRDYDANDAAPNPWTGEASETPIGLDWAVTTFEVSTQKVSYSTYRFEYRVPPPVPQSRLSPAEGNVLWTRHIDPPLGPETGGVVYAGWQRLQTYLASPIAMAPSPFLACDLNRDGQCDAVDSGLHASLIGSCFGQSGYDLQADADGDGCITAADQRLFYPGSEPPGPTPSPTEATPAGTPTATPTGTPTPTAVAPTATPPACTFSELGALLQTLYDRKDIRNRAVYLGLRRMVVAAERAAEDGRFRKAEAMLLVFRKFVSVYERHGWITRDGERQLLDLSRCIARALR